MKKVIIETTPESVEFVYARLQKNSALWKGKLGHGLTYAEKILAGHLADPKTQDWKPGQGILQLSPDRIAMQDATAQMAILQFAQADLPSVHVPTTVHCDHLIRAESGSEKDMDRALQENKEVYDFLRSAANKYGIGFWKPGSGIIHQVVLENYAFPGGLMIGTDSHTPNAGGLGMVAVGVGGADAVDVMAGIPWEVKHPEIIGVHLTGELSGWAAPKDIILYLCGLLTVKGGTNCIIEYFGEGVKSISATGKATITNMGAELGATCSLFPFDERMAKYLEATGRAEVAAVVRKNAELLAADADVLADPGRFYSKVIEIDLSKLEPYVVGPHSPDVARPISQLKKESAEKGFPIEVKAALIGSCTNSSYEDLSRVTQIAENAKAQGITSKATLWISPGSEQIYATAKRDGQVAALENIGAKVLANACGPCIGQWKRGDIQAGEKNSIISSFNRNFPKRNDGNAETLSFIASPEIVLALALAGRLDFNPLTDSITTTDGKTVQLATPQKGEELPRNGFTSEEETYLPPAADGSQVQVEVSPSSNRLQLLSPFAAWDGHDFEELAVLLKAKGKCTTDHISPAGPWLKYRGHLDKISDNLFLGAVNSFASQAGKGINILSNEAEVPLPQIARAYKAKNLRWIAIGDENYGEGSSREHAAMSPRYLGCAAVIVRSFARIHETNLKKQGILPLTFKNPADYDKIVSHDAVSLHGLAELAPRSCVEATILHEDGSEETIQLEHSMTVEQVEWFKAGSALNSLRKKLIEA